MKIRITGTKTECEAAAEVYRQMETSSEVAYCSVSKLYPCRESDKLYRIYIELVYNKKEVKK